MENKEKVMDDYLFNQKFTVSSTGLKLSCHVVLIWFLSLLWLKAFSVEDEKNNLFVEECSIDFSPNKEV